MEIDKFLNRLRLLNVQVYGPLIVGDKGIKISDEGYINSDYDLYIQTHDYKQYEKQFNVLDEV